MVSAKLSIKTKKLTAGMTSGIFHTVADAPNFLGFMILHDCVILWMPLIYSDLRSTLMESMTVYVCSWCVRVDEPLRTIVDVPLTVSEETFRDVTHAHICFIRFQRLPAARLSDSSTDAVVRAQFMGWDLVHSRWVQTPSLILWCAVYVITTLFRLFHLEALWVTLLCAAPGLSCFSLSSTPSGRIARGS